MVRKSVCPRFFNGGSVESCQSSESGLKIKRGIGIKFYIEFYIR